MSAPLWLKSAELYENKQVRWCGFEVQGREQRRSNPGRLEGGGLSGSGQFCDLASTRKCSTV